MKKIILAISLLFLLILTACSTNTTPQVCIKNNCFNVEVVNTPETRQQGLMFREQLDKNAGMLFVFNKTNQHKFWMKNTLIPLDMIWINSEKEITYIQNNAVPCKENPCTVYGPETNNNLYVLEINSGLSKQFQFKEGQIIEFRNIE